MGITMIHAWVAMFFIFISFLHTCVFVAASQLVGDLITLKSGFIDPNNNLNDWQRNSVDPCNWPHVICTPGATTVQQLELQRLDLSGELSPIIGQLGSSIISLDLNDNNISGPIPKEVRSLTGLNFLNLYNNSFNGTIPDELGNLQNLKMLRLFNNSLSGKVPEVLSTLPNLKLTELGNNTDLCGWMTDKPC